MSNRKTLLLDEGEVELEPFDVVARLNLRPFCAPFHLLIRTGPGENNTYE
jgi:hypothetical protein